MTEPWLTLVQALFIYFLLWWIALFCLLQWAIPEFWLVLPRRRGRLRRYLTRKSFSPMGRKFVAASLIAIVATAVVLPLVKSRALSFEVAASHINGRP